MHPLWTATLGAPLRGLALARERGWILAWDATTLHLLDYQGHVLTRRQAPAPLAAACCADDGSALAAVGKKGQVWFFDAELKPRWDRSLPKKGQAIALDPFGLRLAVTDSAANLLLFDRQGQTIGQVTTPRPLQHLCFMAEYPRLIGSADLGLVACFDADGKTLWRDGLVANVASLACSGNGATIALACFTTGLYTYRLDGPPPRVLTLPFPCRLATLSYDGERILAADAGPRVHLTDAAGKVRGEQVLPAPAAAIALAALADLAIVGLADGTLLAFDPRDIPGK